MPAPHEMDEEFWEEEELDEEQDSLDAYEDEQDDDGDEGEQPPFSDADPGDEWEE